MALQPFVVPWPLFQFLHLFYTVGRTPWTGDQALARPLPTHRTTQTQNKRPQTSMPQVGFEPAIPVFKHAKTFRALYHVATVIGEVGQMATVKGVYFFHVIQIFWLHLRQRMHSKSYIWWCRSVPKKLLCGSILLFRPGQWGIPTLSLASYGWVHQKVVIGLEVLQQHGCSNSLDGQLMIFAVVYRSMSMVQGYYSIYFPIEKSVSYGWLHWKEHPIGSVSSVTLRRNTTVWTRTLTSYLRHLKYDFIWKWPLAGTPFRYSMEQQHFRVKDTVLLISPPQIWFATGGCFERDSP
jgi:hypothetical protein